ncbi:MAG: hypothetical protein WDM85_00625 [Caulobacteraceae bacterium]
MQRLGALDQVGALTPHGWRMSGIALPPRLAHMVLRAGALRPGRARRPASPPWWSSAVLAAGRWTWRPGSTASSATADQGARRRRPRPSLGYRGREASPPPAAPLSDALLLAEAWPERIAKARGPFGHFQLATGRGAHMEPTESLAKAPWLAVAELGGGEARDRILLSAELDPAELKNAFADRLTREARLEPDAGGRLRAKGGRRPRPAGAGRAPDRQP